jgi:LAO/AO transport system kinase
VPVTTCSAVSGVGIVEIWDRIRQRVDTLRASGQLAERRRTQSLRWMHAMLQEHLHRRLTESPEALAILAKAEHDVQSAISPPVVAAERAAEAILIDIAHRMQSTKQ